MKFNRLLVTACVTIALSACQTTDNTSSAFLSDEYSQKSSHQITFTKNLSEYIANQNVDSVTRQITAKGVNFLERGDYTKASEYFNSALRLDLTNSYVQFMNAITYHLQAIQGDAEKFELAEQGYNMALRFDESNWLAKYYLGLSQLDKRNFKQAQKHLMEAAMMNNADPEILYDLARSAYYAQDPVIALSAIEKLIKEFPEEANTPRTLRAAAITNAALGQDKTAQVYLSDYRKYSSDIHASQLSNRLSSWDQVYTAKSSDYRGSGFTKAAQQDTLIPGASPSRKAKMNENNEGFDSDMVVVDVVIIRTQEDVSTTKGFNILSGLQLQFGDPLSNTPGFAYDRLKTFGDSGSDSSAITQLISMPSVNYSLNIFNTLAGRNEILARPSLVALQGKTSEFFSGVDVVAAAVSGGDGSAVSISKEIGVKLAVKPEFLEGDRVRLEVEAERTFLTTPSSSVVFEFRLDTSKTTVNANVVMKFGETLVLSGLSEEESEESRDSVPFLGDIPGLQYFFAKQGTREFRKSVIILLTPRRTHYVNRDEGDILAAQAQLSDFEQTVRAYENRFQNYFMPRSTISDVLTMANKNRLFTDFKTGDFELESWHRRDTHSDRLKHALDFLFY